jgi:hypothetical protein
MGCQRSDVGWDPVDVKRLIWVYINNTRGIVFLQDFCWGNGGVQVYKVLY